MIYDFTIVGAGLVGLATAQAVISKFPGAKVLLLEKESGPCKHQSGRNSGVIHSGIYYKPGSYKAQFCSRGRESMIAFCKNNNVRFEECGKLIVATDENQLEYLEILKERAASNNVKVIELDGKQSMEVEPAVKCLRSLWVKSTSICDFMGVADAHIQSLKKSRVELVFNSMLKKVSLPDKKEDPFLIFSGSEKYHTRYFVNCGGLHSDEIARMFGVRPKVKIIPFRGEYYHLKPQLSNLVKGMIYPVPNPNFPFLGVHLTRSIDGEIHAGPNAVLAFKKEGYEWKDVSILDLFQTLNYPAFWKFSSKHFKEAFKEYYRSLNKNAFLKSLQNMVPSLVKDDLIKGTSGVRAQAMDENGKLVDDFLFYEKDKSLHILNAPSPAATSSLEIAKEIVSRISLQ